MDNDDHRHHHIKFASALVLAAALLLASCGYTRAERAGSGAVIGAATGGVVGLLCCGDPINGAGIGIIAGGVTGAAIGALLDDPVLMDHRDE